MGKCAPKKQPSQSKTTVNNSETGHTALSKEDRKFKHISLLRKFSCEKLKKKIFTRRPRG